MRRRLTVNAERIPSLICFWPGLSSPRRQVQEGTVESLGVVCDVDVLLHRAWKKLGESSAHAGQDMTGSLTPVSRGMRGAQLISR